MDNRPDTPSAYRVFSRRQWAKFRSDTPLTLTGAEVARLTSLGDPVDIAEVEAIYLPLSRLLAFYVEAAQQLFGATQRFLGGHGGKTPFVIGIGGSVAVGKSTTARLLRALMSRWAHMPKVDLVTTDGFLLPNAVLRQEGLMERKGFPESYDIAGLLRFMGDIKAGKGPVTAPLYSHLVYDVVAGETITVDRPDILIVEGLNVLQTGRPPREGRAIPFVSDFFDFSIYLDADEALLQRWYIERFLSLRNTAFRDERSFFRKYVTLPESETLATATGLWNGINLPNLRENILPTRGRASLILTKGSSHRVEDVALRRL